MPTRPTSPEVRLERLTAQAVKEGGYDKAILPIGACEYHGPHLPYGTDNVAAETFAEAFARELGQTLVLPTISYGVSPHHLPWSWTMSLRPETLGAIIRDIAESLLHHGIRKLVLLSAHDSNPQVANSAARSLSQDHDMTVAIFSGWQARARVALEGQWDIDPDHGGQSEMSIVLYGAPETARLDLAVDQPSIHLTLPTDVIGKFSDDRPAGYSGHAAQGTAEEGAAVVQAMTDLVVPFLRDLDAHGWKRGPWLWGEE